MSTPSTRTDSDPVALGDVLKSLTLGKAGSVAAPVRSCESCGRELWGGGRWRCGQCQDRVDLPFAEDEALEVCEARAARWNVLCRAAWKHTDPARLQQGPLAQVLAWRYGPKGLMLMGPTEGGKTRAVWLLLKRLNDRGYYIEAFDSASFGRECTARFRGEQADGVAVERWLDNLSDKPHVVFFDDLGKCPFTERVEAELFAVIDRRMANELPIIVTTNMTGDDLIRKASNDRGAPLLRRLRECCQVVTFRGPKP
jgi:hypothetical protein